MKIGLLTFYTAKNIGAQLQAFALYTKLKNFGYDVEFVRYEPKYLSVPYRFFRNVKLKNGMLSVIKQSLLHIVYDTFVWLRTIYHYARFQNRYLDISTKRYCDPMELSRSVYDVFIVGSDQIWNPEITDHQIDPIYSLDFPSSQKLKISYAASFSEKNINNVDVSLLIERLRTFNHISVRENQLATYLKSKSALKIDVVLDPTLLLTKDEWIRFIPRKRIVSSSYVLLYQARGAKKTILQQVEKIANKLNANVIDASGMNYRIRHNGMQYVDPLEFLNLILYAELVVTVSFHGTALSVVLERPFYSILLKDGRDGRVVDLLDRVSLSSQLRNINDELEMPVMNYLGVSKILDKLRSHSIEYLKKSFV